MVNQIVATKILNKSMSVISNSSPLSKKMQNLNLVSGKDEKIISFIDSIKPWILVANDDFFLLQMI
jgi:hypothetical protein